MQIFVKCENENDKYAAWSSEHSDFTLTGRVYLYQIKDHQKNIKRNIIPIGLIFHSVHKQLIYLNVVFLQTFFLPTTMIMYNFMKQSHVSQTNMDIPLSAYDCPLLFDYRITLT